ncbi:hypothetical protein Glove_230g205 [Diversispora epigaea]|uniref:Uncharacterized protein n=1 Tax=Diversispora epigaea TaxID=1348612 RepID=A0A397ID47_9GLOM|nr:hypothetical protein Glove_230g205 [Diversispora epigaea]
MNILSMNVAILKTNFRDDEKKNFFLTTFTINNRKCYFFLSAIFEPSFVLPQSKGSNPLIISFVPLTLATTIVLSRMSIRNIPKCSRWEFVFTSSINSNLNMDYLLNNNYNRSMKKLLLHGLRKE